VTDLEWLEANPDKVKAIRGHDPRKPECWVWCWGREGDWHGAWTLGSAIAAAREAV
jgi:hypothetical protein